MEPVPALFSQVGMGVDIVLPILILSFALIYFGPALILWLVISIVRDPARKPRVRPMPRAVRRILAAAAGILWAVSIWLYLEQGAGSRPFRIAAASALAFTAVAAAWRGPKVRPG